MKKLRRDIQLLPHDAVYLTAIQNFLSAVNHSNALSHSADLFTSGIKNTSYTIIDKTQSFQLPK